MIATKVRIVLFRGINVGGRNTLTVNALRALLADLGCGNVRTYIQSGNAVFEHDTEDPSVLAMRITEAVAERHGFEPEVLVLEVEAVRRAAAANPFSEAESDPSKLHLFFLAGAAMNPDLERIEKLRADSERFDLAAGVAYLYAPEGIGRSKLVSGLETALGVHATARNWRTVCKLLELADATP